MEIIDRIMGFDAQTFYSWIIQLINTGVLVALLSYILYSPVVKFLDNRTKRVEGSIKQAEEMLENAEKMKALYEEKLKGIDEERIQILEAANKRAKDMESEIISSARKEASTIKARAISDIELEKDKASNEMKAQIIDISSIVAQKYVSKKIDKDMQSKLLDEVISDLGDATWLN